MTRSSRVVGDHLPNLCCVCQIVQHLTVSGSWPASNKEAMILLPAAIYWAGVVVSGFGFSMESTSAKVMLCSYWVSHRLTKSNMLKVFSPVFVRTNTVGSLLQSEMCRPVEDPAPRPVTFYSARAGCPREGGLPADSCRSLTTAFTATVCALFIVTAFRSSSVARRRVISASKSSFWKGIVGRSRDLLYPVFKTEFFQLNWTELNWIWSERITLVHV